MVFGNEQKNRGIPANCSGVCVGVGLYLVCIGGMLKRAYCCLPKPGTIAKKRGIEKINLQDK